MEAEATKRCRVCREKKPLTEFNRDRRNKDGRQSLCRVCDRAKTKAYTEANPEKKREREKRRVGRRREYMRRWFERNREKVEERRKTLYSDEIRARRKLRDAVQSGRVTKPECCEACGERLAPLQIEGHHEDYSKPLEVIWLCRACHSALHTLSSSPSDEQQITEAVEEVGSALSTSQPEEGEVERQVRIDREAERIAREHDLTDNDGRPNGTARRLAHEKIDRPRLLHLTGGGR